MRNGKVVETKNAMQEDKMKKVVSGGTEGREKKQMGKQSIIFTSRPVVLAAASVVGKKEGEGPLEGSSMKWSKTRCLAERAGKMQRAA